jgi:hypothetical protein
MIEPVLNRDFVVQNARAALRELKSPPDDRRDARDPLAQLSRDERASVADALDKALAHETGHGTFHGHFERAPEQRRGEAPLVDWAFISHDPTISIVQSSLEKHLRGIANAVVEPSSAADRRGEGRPPAVTATTLRGMAVRSEGDRRVLGAFSETDPRWVACLVAEGIRWFRGKEKFPEQPAAPLDIASNARVLLVGDWGSGLPRARELADKVMRSWIDDAADRERHVIHLGDIYYSGWKSECEERFLAPWPVKPAQAGVITSWCLNGNHDMYCGGRGYFGTVLSDRRFGRQEKSNRFVLRHPKWQILGLDTAYEDDSLAFGQAAWVHEQLTEAHGKKGMLLSHHQLFSAYEGDSKNLGPQLRETLDAGLIRAWFWGHEHRCAIYKPHRGIEFARCIGHGGVPVYQWRGDADPVKEPASYEFRSSFTTSGGVERWAVFGFTVLDFQADGTIHAYYVDASGKAHYGTQHDARGRPYEVIN